METTTCAVCRVDDTALLCAGQDRMFGGNQTFHMVRCHRCGLIYLNPRPTLAEIDRYYPEQYEPFTHANRARNWYSQLAYRVAIAKRCRIASQGQSPGRLLDVGCGDGDFLLGMQERRWAVQGLDISPVAVTIARQKGLDVFLGGLQEADYPVGGFDCITMWDVLEHLHDPDVQLVQVARLLKPGGRLVVTTPNADSLDFRLFRCTWNGLDMPRHLHIYTRTALLALLARAGLQMVSARCVTGGQRVSTWSMEWLFDERLADERKKRVLKRVIYSRVWYWALRPLYFVIDRLGLGSSITYTCQPGQEPAQSGLS